MSDMITASEAASILGVSRVTVWKWRKRGILHASEIFIPGSRVWVYAKKEVESLRRRRARNRMKDTLNNG